MRTENRTKQHCRKFISYDITIAERTSNTDLDGLCVALSTAFKFLFSLTSVVLGMDMIAGLLKIVFRRG